MRLSCVCLAALVAVEASVFAGEPAQPDPKIEVLSPFDQEDPEIQKIRKLDWKNLNFENLDDQQRCAAYFAMNKGLAVMGAKADARLDLLIDYIETSQLGEAMAEAAATITPPPAITYADFQKIAAAFVKTPEGLARLDQELGGIDKGMLPAYTRMYENSSRRSFEEVVESRHQVRLIAVFLEKEGKLPEFKKWAAAERQRRQEAYAAELTQKRTQAAQAEEVRRDQALANAQERQRQQAELAARQMEYALQTQQQAPAGQTVVHHDDDAYWGDVWYPWNGAYYANGVYRAQVRDRAQDSWQKWGGARRPARPTPRRR